MKKSSFVEKQIMDAELEIMEKQFKQALSDCTYEDLPMLEKLEKELSELEASLRELANLLKDKN